MSDTLATTPTPVLVHPETGVEHRSVKSVLGAAPRSKKGEPTIPRSARFFFEAAKENAELLVPVFDTQKVRPAKGEEPMSIPVFSNVFKTDLDTATAVKIFGGESNVVRMAIDYANEVILSSDAVRVRTTELRENATYLEAKRFADIAESRENTRGKDSITPEWIAATKARIKVLVANELELRRAERELEAEGEAEDNRGYEADEPAENEAENEQPAPQSTPKLNKRPGRK